MAAKVGVARQDAALTARDLETVNDDPHRNTGRTAVARGPIGDRLAAAKTGMGQRFAEGLGQRARQPGEYFSFRPPRQIGARPAVGQKKLRYTRATLLSHRRLFPP